MMSSTFEEPVHVLEPVLAHVRMVEHDAADLPVPQIGATASGPRRCGPGPGPGPCASAGRDWTASSTSSMTGSKRIVNFLAPPGKSMKPGCGIERGLLPVVADLDDGGLLTLGPIVHAEDIDDPTLGRHDRVALQPAAELAAEPLRVAAEAVARNPVVRIEQVAVHRRRHHERPEMADPQPPGPMTSSIARQIRPCEPRPAPGHSGTWRRPAAAPSSCPSASVQVTPSSRERLITVKAMVLAGPHQVRVALMDEDAGPVHALDGGDVPPRQPAVDRPKDLRDGIVFSVDLGPNSSCLAR